MKILSSIHLALHRLRVRRALAGNFSFIHINKCGGTSVEKALGLPKMHHTARMRRDLIGKDRWDAIPSFALVRCPYDKVTSHYRYRVKTGHTDLGPAGLGLNEWIRESYGAKNRKYYDKPRMFAPCVEWVTDEDGAVMVDLIIRLEDINEKWHDVQSLISRTAALPKANTTSHTAASATQGLDAQSIDIIDEHFHDDFEMFGYERLGQGSRHTHLQKPSMG